MSLEHILLGMLHRPASGYDLRNEFRHGAANFWTAGLNQIYPTLQKMESNKWLRSQEQPSSKGPPRRVYSRTAKGTRELKKWLDLEPQLSPYRLAYVAQLVFMGQLDDLDRTRSFLVQLRGTFRERLEVMLQSDSPEDESPAIEILHDAFNRDPSSFPNVEFHYLLGMELGRQVMTSRVNACDVLIDMIDRKRKATNRD